MSRPRTYDEAPRLPEGDALTPCQLLGGAADPIELEIGPGRGGFIVERLAADPAVRIVGLEVRRKWATLVDQRLAAEGQSSRARVFAEDARTVLVRLAGETVLRVYVHFPDPWWKNRHAKRLVVCEPVVREVARLLVPGGQLFIQTDVEDRARDYEGVVASVPGLEPRAAGGLTVEGGANPPLGPRLEENPFGARSPRERRAVADGLPIFRLLYQRTGARA